MRHLPGYQMLESNLVVYLIVKISNKILKINVCKSAVYSLIGMHHLIEQLYDLCPLHS